MSQKLAIPKRKTMVTKNALKPKRSLRSRIAISLLSLIALVSFIFLVLPYVPRLAFWISRPKIDPTSYQQAAVNTKKGQPAVSDASKPGNRLVLPDIGLDSQILEGPSINVIGKNQGVWHESGQTNPTVDGNIVVAGHRWMGYDIRNIGQFYNLPELKNGSIVYVRWENKTFAYEVYNTRSVYPTQVDIRDPDPNVPKKLTMYTCFPLGSTAKRFVVEAKQI